MTFIDLGSFAPVNFAVTSTTGHPNSEGWQIATVDLMDGTERQTVRWRYGGSVLSMKLPSGEINKARTEDKFILVEGRRKDRGDETTFDGATVRTFSGRPGTSVGPLQGRLETDQRVSCDKSHFPETRFQLRIGPSDGTTADYGRLATSATGDSRVSGLSPHHALPTGYTTRSGDTLAEEGYLSFVEEDGRGFALIPIEPIATQK